MFYPFICLSIYHLKADVNTNFYRQTQLSYMFEELSLVLNYCLALTSLVSLLLFAAVLTLFLQNSDILYLNNLQPLKKTSDTFYCIFPYLDYNYRLKIFSC